MRTALCINPDREGCKVTSFYLFFVLLRLKPTCRKLSDIIPRMNKSLFSPPYVVENEQAELTPIRDSPCCSHPDGPFTGFAVTAAKWYVVTLCWGATYLLFSRSVDKIRIGKLILAHSVRFRAYFGTQSLVGVCTRTMYGSARVSVIISAHVLLFLERQVWCIFPSRPVCYHQVFLLKVFCVLNACRHTCNMLYQPLSPKPGRSRRIFSG
jgi:hypothetical protein